MKKNTQSTGEKNKGIFTRAAIANSECANGRTCAQNNWILFIAKQRQLHSEGQSMLRIILAVQTNTKKKRKISTGTRERPTALTHSQQTQLCCTLWLIKICAKPFIHIFSLFGSCCFAIVRRSNMFLLKKRSRPSKQKDKKAIEPTNTQMTSNLENYILQCNRKEKLSLPVFNAVTNVDHRTVLLFAQK